MKIKKSKRYLVLFGLTSLICLSSASPLWLNQCSHKFTESEVTYLMQRYDANIEEHKQDLIGFGKFSEDEIKEKVEKHRQYLKIEEAQQRLEKTYIPCGVGNASPEEKEEIANNYAGLFDDQLFLLPLPALRIDLDYSYLDRSTPRYYFQAYTFFYIPVFCIRSILPGRLLEFYDSTCPMVQ